MSNGEAPQSEAAVATANYGAVGALCFGILRPFIQRAILRQQQSENAQERQEAADDHNLGNAEAVDEVAERQGADSAHAEGEAGDEAGDRADIARMEPAGRR